MIAILRRTAWSAALVAVACLAGPAAAHFQELIPSADVLPDGGSVTLDLRFTHPMEQGPAMEMVRPARFGVLHNGTDTDLLDSLESATVDGHQAWTASHTIAEPGAAVFYVAPQPYWEPAEGKHIIHYTKVVVDSYASGEGWDAMVGLPVEIRPLTRPTGLWTGNLFRGVVEEDGAPVPFAEVEVEYRNDGTVGIPNDAFVTQVIRADADGVFAYAMPRAGWWGFAALTEAAEPMPAPDGSPAPVETGALIWVQATDMPEAGG
ncbi:MAG: DUF4198 domain-containing protein [Alphaproteobacteria bacterium]|nr:DUF4198 domain-containing protein [Alphaproteobacteria bacterium]